MTTLCIKFCTDHVPDVVGDPVDHPVDAADELQVFGLDGFLVD